MRAYQQVCTDVIQRYDGHIAQLLGDGLLVYFGYPQAHEDDAQQSSTDWLGYPRCHGSPQYPSATRQRYRTRSPSRDPYRAGRCWRYGQSRTTRTVGTGEAPNIAARMQGLAAPNTLVISDATYRLVQGYFACQDLGEQTLRGVAEAIAVYHVLRESGATSRLDIAQPEDSHRSWVETWKSRSSRSVGHRSKLGTGTWSYSRVMQVLVKVRLVHMLKEHVANQPHTRWECRSVPYLQEHGALSSD